MLQQKQQKNSRAENFRFKDQTKIGTLSRKSNFPPIQIRSSSPSKNHYSLSPYFTPKKYKIPEIYYEEVSEKKPQKSKINSIITQRDSIFQHTMNNEDDKQQTVIKMHQKKKANQNSLHLCDFHQKRVTNQLQKQQKSDQTLSKVKAHRCCQTQPSDDQSYNDSPNKMFFHPNLIQNNRNSKDSVSKFNQKSRIIKVNRYQRSQFMNAVGNKYFSSEKNAQNRHGLPSKAAQIMASDKLSQPKCAAVCGRRNCQCFNQNRLPRIESPFNRGSMNYGSERQIPSRKININVNKLKQLNSQETLENEDQNNGNDLKNKINEKKTWRRNMKLKQLRRFNTEAIQSQKFFQGNNQNQNGPSPIGSSSRKISSDDDSFIKGIATPSKITIDQRSDISQNTHTIKTGKSSTHEKKLTAEIQIQTQDILIVNEPKGINKKYTQQKNQIQSKNQSLSKENQIMSSETQKQETIPSGIKIHSKGTQTDQNFILQKKNLDLTGHNKGIRKIGYTFGKNEETENTSRYHLNNSSNQNKRIYKSKEQKLQSLQHKIQYCIRYDIERKVFIDFLNIDQNKAPLSKGYKISLVREVVNEKIMLIKTQQTQPKQQAEIDIESISQVPIEINRSQKKETLKDSRILEKSRNCGSSRSNKNSINMFNRSPKSIASTKGKRFFQIPKEEEYGNFIKNYKPENPQIIIPTLIKQETFKVILSAGKFYFGQVEQDNIKQGLGVEISPHQIFQGKYVNGNRKQGFLKQHDGIYQGPFQNNLRHGYGIFRWNDGQIFQGQWRMGTKNGYGVWKGTDGSYYEGEWHLSMQHGKGKFVHPTSTYEGDFKNFFKEGSGKQTFPNGDVFNGQYKNGKPNGKGKYEWKDGTYYEGDFVQGLKQGLGKWHQDSHSLYEGQFLNDQKHGKGIEYHKDGRYLQGQFFKGKIQEGKLYSTRKQLIQEISEQFQQNS